MKKSFILDLFSRIPTLTTERLTLRALKPSDYLDMYEYSKQERVTEFLLWEPHNSPSQTKDHLRYVQKKYREGGFYDWALVDNETSKMIGTCGFTTLDFNHNFAEIGYVINPDHWGKGIAAEAVRCVIEFAFSRLNVHRVEAKYIAENENSRRVMEKCGMTFEGIHRGSMYIKGQYRDIGICSIIYEDYLKEYKL